MIVMDPRKIIKKILIDEYEESIRKEIDSAFLPKRQIEECENASNLAELIKTTNPLDDLIKY